MTHHAPADHALRSQLLPWSIRGAGLALGAGLVIGLFELATAAGRVLLLVFVAILLASALEPFIGWIRAHVALGRGATVLVVYAVFFALVLGLALVILPTAYTQAEETIARLPPFFAEAHRWAADLRPEGLGRSLTALVDAAEQVLIPRTPPDPNQIVQVGLTVAETAVSVATVLTLVFLWLVEHARIQRYVLAFVTLDRRAGAREAWNEVEARLGMWVRGQLTLMIAMGTATGIAYGLLGVPAATVLALIAGLTEVVPIVGPLLGAVPAILVAATVSPQLGLAVAGVYVVLQFLEGNVLVPIVMRNSVGISPLLVIISLLVGAAAGGLIGAIFAVPIAASLEIVLARAQSREVPVAQDPGAVETPDDEETAGMGQTLPDAPGSVAAR